MSKICYTFIKIFLDILETKGMALEFYPVCQANLPNVLFLF